MRIAAALLFTILPGGWITFGLRLPGFSFGERLVTGLTLAPLVLPAQLYLLRALGVPFETAAAVLVAANLPVAWLAARRFDRTVLSSRALAGSALLVALCAACLAPQIADRQSRAYSGHAWMYADTAYLAANGDLDLEEAELAGVRLAYPWAGLVFQAVVSFLAGSTPVAAYIWVNLLWLAAVGFFSAAIVREMGGSRLSRAAAVVWLFFGVNFLGYLLLRSVRAVRGDVDVRYLFAQFGDGRFTPWLAKFLFLQQEPFALGLFGALLFVLVREWPGGLRGGPAALAGVLLAGLGLVYPILFPAGCAAVAAGIAAALSDSSRADPAGSKRQAIALGVALAAAGAVATAHLAFVTRDSVGGILRWSDAWWITAKTISAGIVLAPLLVGLVLTVGRSWRLRRRATIVLVGSLFGSLALFVALWIGEWRNEYKFVLTAAFCAAPFPSLALEPLAARLGRLAAPVFGSVGLVLALPLAHKFALGWPLEGFAGPSVEVRGFDLRLASGERFAGLTDAIRERTPSATIVVLGEDPGIHFPTLTRRKLYVPPPQEKAHPGVGEKTEDLFRIIKGYDLRIVDERRRIVRVLFSPSEDARRMPALGRILEHGRPIAVVLDERRHAALARWLESHGAARRLYRDRDGSVWLVGPPDPASRPDSTASRYGRGWTSASCDRGVSSRRTPPAVASASRSSSTKRSVFCAYHQSTRSSLQISRRMQSTGA